MGLRSRVNSRNRRKHHDILIGLAVVLFVVGMGIAQPSTASDLPLAVSNATTRVIDGDTLQIGGLVVQLAGIDAPELGQQCGTGKPPDQCGREAADNLLKRVRLATIPGHIRCFPIRQEKYLIVATCLEGDKDLSAELIEAGAVTALTEGDPYYVKELAPLYQTLEAEAKKTGIGIWATKFQMPKEWRAAAKQFADTEIDSYCVIKGGRDAAGRKLYYVPSDPEYAGLAKNPGPDDRRFCSDEDARAAGWKRPGESVTN